jgi:acetyl-CoA carboxylase biotin carboxyl carrier protein
MTDISVQDIEALVRSFDDSDWDEMRVVVDGLELFLSKNSTARLVPSPGLGPSIVTATDKTLPSAAASVTPTSTKTKPAAVDVPDGMVVVRAPNLGTFYRSPKPGAPPYVSIGQKVEPETELCLIEVMKLFTSVSSGIKGTVQRVLVEDSQLVEFDQPLFLIDPRS